MFFYICIMFLICMYICIYILLLTHCLLLNYSFFYSPLIFTYLLLPLLGRASPCFFLTPAPPPPYSHLSIPSHIPIRPPPSLHAHPYTSTHHSPHTHPHPYTHIYSPIPTCIHRTWKTTLGK